MLFKILEILFIILAKKVQFIEFIFNCFGLLTILFNRNRKHKSNKYTLEKMYKLPSFLSFFTVIFDVINR